MTVRYLHIPSSSLEKKGRMEALDKVAKLWLAYSQPCRVRIFVSLQLNSFGDYLAIAEFLSPLCANVHRISLDPLGRSCVMFMFTTDGDISRYMQDDTRARVQRAQAVHGHEPGAV